MKYKLSKKYQTKYMRPKTYLKVAVAATKQCYWAVVIIADLELGTYDCEIKKPNKVIKLQSSFSL